MNGLKNDRIVPESSTVNASVHSPSVDTSTVRFPTSDGLVLEGRLAVPEAPAGIAVICHPHPRFEGSMSSAMIPAIWRALAAEGWAALRFNFRGVGRSEGTYGDGLAEVTDAAAAFAFMREQVPDRPLSAAGWSFGAIVGLHASVADGEVDSYVAIAPPASIKAHMLLPPLPQGLDAWAGRMLAICGTQDGFCTPAGLRRWAGNVPGSEVKIFEGEDHFFTSGRDELAKTAAAFIAEA